MKAERAEKRKAESRTESATTPGPPLSALRFPLFSPSLFRLTAVLIVERIGLGLPQLEPLGEGV